MRLIWSVIVGGALSSFACAAAAQALLLYGGRNHDIFLGCINCSEYENASICNSYGSGSKYENNSIFNQYGNFGSSYSDSSPWNQYSASETVPVVVDENGNFYGYFTINRFRADAVEYAADLFQLYENSNGDLAVVQNFLCQ